MKGFLLSTVALISMFGLSSAAWAQQQTRPHGQHMWNDGGWMFLGPLMMIVFIGVIIAVIVVVVALLFRRFKGPDHESAPSSSHSRSPLDILKERLARGEIDEEEFEERRRTLDE